MVTITIIIGIIILESHSVELILSKIKEVNNLGASPRGIRTKISLKFKASLGAFKSRLSS